MTDRLQTDTELAQRYGKSRAWVQAQCYANRWPHLKVGKSYRFTAADVASIDALLAVPVKDAQPAGAVAGANPFNARGRSS